MTIDNKTCLLDNIRKNNATHDFPELEFLIKINTAVYDLVADLIAGAMTAPVMEIPTDGSVLIAETRHFSENTILRFQPFPGVTDDTLIAKIAPKLASEMRQFVEQQTHLWGMGKFYPYHLISSTGMVIDPDIPDTTVMHFVTRYAFGN